MIVVLAFVQAHLPIGPSAASTGTVARGHEEPDTVTVVGCAAERCSHEAAADVGSPHAGCAEVGTGIGMSADLPRPRRKGAGRNQ